MAASRGQRMLLAALVTVAALLAYQVWPTAPEAPASTPERPARARATRGVSTAVAPEVHLAALEAPHPKPLSQGRDLFRFKPKPPPPPPVAPPPPVVAPPVFEPPPPPRLPPIPYRYIGYVEQQGRKTAVLSDGQHPPIRGREGDVIEGRFRIIRIGTDSIEMAYADGRGRQTIRLQGS